MKFEEKVILWNKEGLKGGGIVYENKKTGNKFLLLKICAITFNPKHCIARLIFLSYFFICPKDVDDILNYPEMNSFSNTHKYIFHNLTMNSTSEKLSNHGKQKSSFYPGCFFVVLKRYSLYVSQGWSSFIFLLSYRLYLDWAYMWRPVYAYT